MEIHLNFFQAPKSKASSSTYVRPEPITTREKQMEKKEIRRIILGIGCLLVLALIFLNIYQYQHVNSFSQEINKETPGKKTRANDSISKKEKNASIVTKQKQSGSNDPDNRTHQLEAAEEKLDMAHDQLSAAQAKKAE
jgi:hypothetical protein